MRATLFVLFLLFVPIGLALRLPASPAFALQLAAVPASDDEAMLLADHAFVTAVATRDTAAAGKLLDTRFTWTDTDGETASRAEALKGLPTPDTNIGTGAQVTARVYGAVGLVRVDDGSAHVLRVWVKRPQGWRVMVVQEVASLDAPSTLRLGTGKSCENPCQTVPYTPKSEAEQGVIASYKALETAAAARDANNWRTHVADEFAAASSYHEVLLTKTQQMAEFAKGTVSVLAPVRAVNMTLVDFGDTIVMLSKEQPDRGSLLRTTRLWTKRNGTWVILVSFQTAILKDANFPFFYQNQ